MRAQTILLFLIAFLVGSDEFLLGPILTPIGSDLGVAPERISLFVSAYAVPLALLAPLFGALSDRHGRRAVLLPASLVFALGSLATALAPTYSLALASRIVTGAGAAGMLPVAFSLAADSGDEGADRDIAAVQAGLTLGIIASPAFGAWVTEAFGWQAAFATLGTLALLTLAGTLRLGQGMPSTTRHPETREQSWPPGSPSAILGMGLGLGGAVGIYVLVGERLRDLHQPGTDSLGLIYAGFGLVTLAGNLAMPRLMARFGDGRRLMRLCLIGVLAAIMVLFAIPLGMMAACLMLGAWALLGGIGAPALQAHLAGLSDARRGTLMALGASAMNLGVATWSATASTLFPHSAILVALLALAIIGTAICLLGPIRSELLTT
ncbi:MFS transporter [Halomonas sp. I1]|uniref:MFS transporter n=1 Tax=Halomonas sp. I1 TaxID=393536 RepID=UPI0028E04234|nr:MFS transporter [Halomonas sp. I1]MDT8894399.1 MFS transporter [Halomonas sp. I1]